VGAPTFNFQKIGATCGTASTTEVLDMNYPPSAVPIYTLTDTHYQYNWSTKGLQNGLYRIYATLSDTTSRTVDICLTK
jgi:hypothetical protein